MVELVEPELGELLEGADGGGAGRRRGREDEAGPSAEADGAEAGRLAKMMRSPPHGGDGDGLSEDELAKTSKTCRRPNPIAYSPLNTCLYRRHTPALIS